MQVYINHCTKVRKEGNMRVRKISKLKIMLVLIGVAAFLFGPGMAEVMAQTAEELCLAQPDGADFDADGFNDFDECNGLVYDPSHALLTFDGYSAYMGNPFLTEYLNPVKPDLFVIMVKENTTLVPDYFQEYLLNLGITVHEIDPVIYPEVNVDRYITVQEQKAPRITEDLTPSSAEDDPLGSSFRGTPNGFDQARVYTRRIADFVDEVCLGAQVCNAVLSDGSEMPYPDFVPVYINHTIAHECGHMTKLTASYDKRFGGYHYKAGTRVVMEQFVKYTAKGNKVTFYISTEYADPDLIDKQLSGY